MPLINYYKHEIMTQLQLRSCQRQPDILSAYSIHDFEVKINFSMQWRFTILKSDIGRLERLFSTFNGNNFADVSIKNIVHHYRANHKFWRSELNRNICDPDFWSPFKTSVRNLAGNFISRLSELARRLLTDPEK